MPAMPQPTRDVDLTGKKAMVVGAEHPAGAAIARAYAAAGADVALCSLTADEAVMRARAVRREIEAMGRRAAEYVMDVTLGKNVQVTTRQVAKEMGGLDLVASAPDLVLAKLIEQTTDMELARVMQVNFSSQFFIVRTAAQEFRRDHRPGRVTLVTGALASGAWGEPAAPGSALPGSAAYASAHGAVHHLVRAASRELAAEGIAVNAIALDAMEGMDRIDGRADGIGPTAVWLAGASGATLVTGQIIFIAAGSP